MSIEVQFGTVIVLAMFCLAFLDYSSVMPRIAGYETGRNALGYSLQNATFMTTRLFYIVVMMCMAFLVDRGSGPTAIALIGAAGMLAGGTAGLLVWVGRRQVVAMFGAAIVEMERGTSLIRAIFRSVSASSQWAIPENTEGAPSEGSRSSARSVAILTTVIYLFHGASPVVAFMLAANTPEYRATLSQLTTVLNAIGTALLTLYLDPTFSVSIERKADFMGKVRAYYCGRFVATFAAGPIMVLFGLLLV